MTKEEFKITADKLINSLRLTKRNDQQGRREVHDDIMRALESAYKEGLSRAKALEDALEFFTECDDWKDRFDVATQAREALAAYRKNGVGC